MESTILSQRVKSQLILQQCYNSGRSTWIFFRVFRVVMSTNNRPTQQQTIHKDFDFSKLDIFCREVVKNYFTRSWYTPSQRPFKQMSLPEGHIVFCDITVRNLAHSPKRSTRGGEYLLSIFLVFSTIVFNSFSLNFASVLFSISLPKFNLSNSLEQ